MSLIARKYWLTALALPLFMTACSQPSPFKVAEKKPSADADAPFDPPTTYPGWAFDAPTYVKPVQELTPEPKAKPGDPLHYFTKEKIVMVRQPSGYTPEEIPRIAVWWSDNNGFHWQKAGFFGREQSYFPFEVQEDGDYGVRFVGPGQDQSLHATAYPERVYHVDTTIPEVEVGIEPEQTWYNVGQSVTISWRADDFHLIELPVTVTALLDFTADESKPIEIQKGLAKEGSITYQIPPESLNHEMRFRVDALDRANNLGIAYSFALQVVTEPVDDAKPKSHEPPIEEQVSHTVPPTRMSRPLPTTNSPRLLPKEPAPEPVTEPVSFQTKPKKVAPVIAPTDDIIEDDTTTGVATNQKMNLDVASTETKKKNKPKSAEKVAQKPQPKNADRAASARKNSNVVASNPQISDDNVSPANFPEVSPADAAGNYTPIEPLDSGKNSTDSSAKPAGEPLSANDKPLPIDNLPSLIVSAKDDFTYGNRLMIPMPATVETKNVEPSLAMAHPWRNLGEIIAAPLRTVWALPNAEFINQNPALKTLFLAGAQMLRPVGDPPKSESHFAGLTPKAADDLNGSAPQPQ